MKGNIDRKSGNLFVVILEDGSTLNLNEKYYPQLKVGDIIDIYNGKVIVDEKTTKELKKTNIKLQKELFKREAP